jgi:RNA polymerase sigma factor (TIGR02999 family)
MEPGEDGDDGLCSETARLLRGVEANDEGARSAFFALVYTELHRRAHALMRRQPPGHTLQPTALVGEVYLRLFRGVPGPWNDRKHFLMAASQAMHHALIDHWRRKRNQPPEVCAESPLDEIVVGYESNAVDLEALSRALERLEEFDPPMAQAVELRFFGGCSVEETARILGMPVRSFERSWQMTRAWLYGEVR